MEIIDVAVIGGGVTGMSAAMYSARFNLSVVAFVEQPGGLIATTNLVENYPGIKSINGAEMGQLFIEQALDVGAKIKYEKVVSLAKKDGLFKLSTASGEHYAKTVILATGTKHKKLGAVGEMEYQAKGVTYCALCDGAFYRNKPVAVIGGGDTAAIDANILTQFASKIYVLVRKNFMRAEPVNLKRLEQSDKVEILYETEVNEIRGDDKNVQNLLLKNGKVLDVSGVFIAIGWDPVNELAVQVGAEVDERGEVIVNRETFTNIPGFFAAGDVTNAKFKQAIIGAAEGVYASVGAYNYIQSLS